MTTRTNIIAAFVAAAALVLAQKPKSKGELEALQAIQAEQDPTARMAKVDAFIQKYADTEFKEWALTRAAEAAEAKNDSAKLIIYSELAIDANPKAYSPMLMEAAELARTTRENDLDKEEKLSKAEKLAHQAMDIVPTATKPNPQIPDDQWEGVKKDYLGDAHRDLGMVASVRKKYDVAITEFKQASEVAAHPDPAVYVRLAGAYTDNKQPDEALAVLAKVNTPALKPFVDKETKRAQDLKAAKK
jgi:tetratricopeptide (TPR) repeat protein